MILSVVLYINIFCEVSTCSEERLGDKSISRLDTGDRHFLGIKRGKFEQHTKSLRGHVTLESKESTIIIENSWYGELTTFILSKITFWILITLHVNEESHLTLWARIQKSM